MDGEDSEDSEDSNSDEGSDEDVGGDSDKMEWGKKVEPELRKWISCEECRRDMLDKYFNNPTSRKGDFILNSPETLLNSVWYT